MNKKINEYTGRQCQWADIEVGEVFAWNGCWSLAIKIDKSRFQCFATDHYNWSPNDLEDGQIWHSCWINNVFPAFKLGKKWQIW